MQSTQYVWERPGWPKLTFDAVQVAQEVALARRVQGVVTIDSLLSPTGCVARAEVTGPVAPSLDWSALKAVLAWRFTPTVMDGTPVPVIMAVTVQFSLK